jgi:tRNA threonylcarbamoyladenosine biosynthesis protein TsaB
VADVWLLIETSGRGGLVGVHANGQLVSESLDPKRRHNRDLASTTTRLLTLANCTVRDLNGVMVSVGPGSFTGLRVGLMSAKMLAYTLNCPLVPVPTFAILAQQAPAECELVDVLSDGLQGLIYAQRFRRGASKQWESVTQLKILSIADWVQTLPSESFVSGPAVELVVGTLKPEQPCVDSSARIASLAAMYEVGKRCPGVNDTELLTLEPLYLRPSSAEEQAAKRGL